MKTKTIMPFGKYKDRDMDNIPASYLDWLEDQHWLESWPIVRNYIEKNRSRIDKELEEEGEI